MEDYSPVVVVSLISLIVGFVLGYRRPYIAKHEFQNSGERGLSRRLLSQLHPPDFHLLNHLTVRTKDGTTQIDHVLVSRFGVFVIETKDYSGWIFANAADRYWTQVLYRVKFRFRNPIHQNFKHLCAIRDILDFVSPAEIRSAVVFVGRGEFKTPTPEGVYQIADFIKYVESKSIEVLSSNRMQFCVGRLETHRLSLTRITDVDHVQRLRSKYGDRD